MTEKPDPAVKQTPAQAARQARLDAALRANIKRRKAADAARTQAETDESGADNDQGED
jgi:hypothetical protein